MIEFQFAERKYFSKYFLLEAGVCIPAPGGDQRVLHLSDDSEPLTTRAAGLGQRLPHRSAHQDRAPLHRGGRLSAPGHSLPWLRPSEESQVPDQLGARVHSELPAGQGRLQLAGSEEGWFSSGLGFGKNSLFRWSRWTDSSREGFKTILSLSSGSGSSSMQTTQRREDDITPQWRREEGRL